MIQKIAIILFFIFFLDSAFSQSQRWRLTRFEVSAGIGTSYTQTDIGGYKNILESYKGIDILGTRPSFFFGARYKLTEKIATKVNFSIAWLSGRDALGDYPNRRFSFETFMFEPTARLEYFLLREHVIGPRYSIMDLRGGIRNRYYVINVYLFLGAGGAYIIPFVNEKIKADRRYHSDYGHFILVIPTGIGVRYLLTRQTLLNLEFAGQYAFSDYIDGFNSKYPKTSANDFYFFANLNFVYKFRTNIKGLPVFKHRKYVF
jgi:hypothetical protein